MPGWILVPSDPWRCQEKLLCSVVTASTPTLCAALHGQSNVGSMCDCKSCWSLDLSVLIEILSGVDSDHGTGPRRNGSVNSRSTLCPIERRSCLPRRSFKLSSGCLRFVNFFLLDLASIKTLLTCSILLGVWKTDFFKLKVSQWSLQQPSCQCHQPQ